MSQSQQVSTPINKWTENSQYRNVKEFTPSAPEFVPGIQYYNNASLANHDDAGISSMNLSANEYIPGGGSTAVEASSLENMVEVHWDGNTFYAPESMTYIGEDGSVVYMGSLEDIDIGGNQIGLLWANNSMTLPAPPKRTLQTIGIPEPIRNHFQSLDIESLRQMPPDDPKYKELPARYHSAFPLGCSVVHATTSTGNSFGYPSSLYKAINQLDSQLYVLRRLDNVRTAQSVVVNTINSWQNIQHPGVVPLYNIIYEKGALFFSYAYYPASQSLKERFIDQRGPMLGEALIWRIFMQLFSAMRLVHGRGISIRVIDPAHIILSSGTCARYSCVGILDVLEFESRKTLAELQQDDLIKLGRLILSLATRAMITSSKNITDAITILKQHYSSDLQRAVSSLLSGKASLNQISIMLIDRIHDEFDTSMMGLDALHSHLRFEYENGRLLRLLMKFGFLNERPDQWSETADQYVLKLFRDYVFHQTDADGLPILDAGHILTALNKLDTGDPEEILLNSRDGKDLLVVSFADVQRCLEKSFIDLSEQQRQPVPTILSAPSQPHQQSMALSMATQPQHQQHQHQSGYTNNTSTGSGYNQSQFYGQRGTVSGRTHPGAVVATNNSTIVNASTSSTTNNNNMNHHRSNPNLSHRMNHTNSTSAVSDNTTTTSKLLHSHHYGGSSSSSSGSGSNNNNNNMYGSSSTYFPNTASIANNMAYDNTTNYNNNNNNNYLPMTSDFNDGRSVSGTSISQPARSTYNMEGINNNMEGINNNNNRNRGAVVNNTARSAYNMEGINNNMEGINNNNNRNRGAVVNNTTTTSYYPNNMGANNRENPYVGGDLNATNNNNMYGYNNGYNY